MGILIFLPHRLQYIVVKEFKFQHFCKAVVLQDPNFVASCQSCSV